jgi:epoxide hydrolase-like predicted phosphatase
MVYLPRKIHQAIQEKMENQQIKAIIWDMGGVILRTEDPCPREKLAEELGITRGDLEKFVFTSQSAIQATSGEISSREHYQEIARRFKLDDEGLQNFFNDFWRGDRVDEILLEEIRNLRKQYKTAMLSNAWSEAREFLTKDFPCLEPFDVAIFSAEVKMVKPQPGIYRLMLNALGIKPGEAVFFDDFPENIVAAKILGIHAFQFISREQALADLAGILAKQDQTTPKV